MKRTPLRKVSRKQASLLRKYSKAKDEFLLANPICHTKQGRPKGCWLRSNQVHHVAGRGQNLLRSETWMAVCSNCHAWIHSHPKEARQLGYLK
jgi:hypothetical protein